MTVTPLAQVRERNGEDKETNFNPLEHTDDRYTGEHEEKTEAGKVDADQMEKEKFKECSEARAITRLAHTIVGTTGIMLTSIQVAPVDREGRFASVRDRAPHQSYVPAVPACGVEAHG